MTTVKNKQTTQNIHDIAIKNVSLEVKVLSKKTLKHYPLKKRPLVPCTNNVKLQFGEHFHPYLDAV